MMDGFTPISFAKRGDVSISKNGISIPTSRMPMFPDGRCNYLENGAMIALQPCKDGDVTISIVNQNGVRGRIWNVFILRRAAETLGVTLDKNTKLNTWVDEGCLVFAKRKM